MGSFDRGNSNATGTNSYSGAVTGEKVPKGYKKSSVNTYTPEMMDLLNQMYGQVDPDSFLYKMAMGDQSAFDEVETPALKQFSALQGNMASRFSGMGMGARNSSGFQNTSNQAATDFAEQLASQRMNMRFKALEELMGFSDKLLGRNPYDTQLQEKQKPWWQEAAIGLANTAGQEAVKSGMRGASVAGL